MERLTYHNQANGLNVKRYTMGAAALLLACAGTARAQALPEFISMMGVVRDFQSAHPDFATSPSLGYGHYAGNVSLTVDASGKPTYTGLGYLVNAQWRDNSGREIAPHMFNHGNMDYWTWDNAGVSVGSTILVNELGTIDSWDSTSGSYADTVGNDALIATNGGGNSIQFDNNSSVGGVVLAGPGSDPADIGTDGDLDGMTGSLLDSGTMPTIEEPVGMGPNTGDVTFAGTTTLTTKLHCNNLLISNNGALLIDGNIRILVEGTLTMRQNAQIQLLPGASLEIYTKGEIRLVYQNADINTNTQDPSRVWIYHMTAAPIFIEENSQVFANIVAPLATMSINNNGDLYGSYTGQSVTVGQNAGLHVDTVPYNPLTACGNLVADAPGAEGGDSTGGITSADTFNQWFNDTPGVNISKRNPITMTLAADGNYEFMTDAFFPINGRLYGNEGSAENHYFTYEIEGMFTYAGCSDQIFEFEADDDAWIFVNDFLVIDLGGMRAGVPQTIELDRLGLTDGQDYSFKLFYAQRQGTDATFRLRTNVRVMTDPEVIALSSPILFD